MEAPEGCCRDFRQNSVEATDFAAGFRENGVEAPDFTAGILDRIVWKPPDFTAGILDRIVWKPRTLVRGSQTEQYWALAPVLKLRTFVGGVGPGSRTGAGGSDCGESGGSSTGAGGCCPGG